MSEREKVDTYTIPPNFAESGKWFSGRVCAGHVVGDYLYSSSSYFCSDWCAGRTFDFLSVSYLMFSEK